MEMPVFNRFRELIHRQSGISLSDEKRALLENRIARRLRALNISSEREYLEVVELDATGEELVELVDAVTTNVTAFYREPAHFRFLEQWARSEGVSRQRIRFWCAASSSGEEPYTIAMTVAENLDLARHDFRLLATDICTGVLRTAARARYQQRQLKDVPPGILPKYFRRVETDTERNFEVVPLIRNLVAFRKLNLAEVPFGLKPGLDMIFCRNVMIYFDLTLRARLIRHFHELLAPGGYLVIGHSENLLGIEHSFQSVQTGVYHKTTGLR